MHVVAVVDSDDVVYEEEYHEVLVGEEAFYPWCRI